MLNMSSKDTSTNATHQRYKYATIETQDLGNLIEFEQNSNQFTVECKKCQIPFCNGCNECNIIPSNVYNNIDQTQEQNQAMLLNESFSTLTEQIECVIMRSDKHQNTTDNLSNTSSIERNYRPYYQRNYDISRSVSLKSGDVDLNNDTLKLNTLKLKQKETLNNDTLKCGEIDLNNDTLNSSESEYRLYRYYQNMNANTSKPSLKLENLTMSTVNTSKPSLKLENLTVSTVSTTHTLDSMTALEPNSPNNNENENESDVQNRLVAITRLQSAKSYKLVSSKGSSLKTLSELSEFTYDNNNNKHNKQSSCFSDSVEEAFDEYVNTEYCEKTNDGYNSMIKAQQQALQEAYLKGFTEGYATGVQFQFSKLNLPVQPSI